MNRWKNGTIKIGQEGSYQGLLSEFEDILKTNDSEVTKVAKKIIKRGKQVGFDDERIKDDLARILGDVDGI